jgi:hypothetical protein
MTLSADRRQAYPFEIWGDKAMTAQVGTPGGMRVPWRAIGWGTAGALLLIPALANFPWTQSDYLFAAILFGTIGLTLELTFRKSANPFFRLAVGLALAVSFFLVWISGAVGIIGDEGDPANLLFSGVLGIALLGSFVSRGRPGGMAWAMATAGVAELLVPVAALIIWPEHAGAIWSPEVPVITLVFAATWFLSAALFGKARRTA